jgi:hypothetical protein
MWCISRRYASGPCLCHHRVRPGQSKRQDRGTREEWLGDRRSLPSPFEIEIPGEAGRLVAVELTASSEIDSALQWNDLRIGLPGTRKGDHRIFPARIQEQWLEVSTDHRAEVCAETKSCPIDDYNDESTYSRQPSEIQGLFRTLEQR